MPKTGLKRALKLGKDSPKTEPEGLRSVAELLDLAKRLKAAEVAKSITSSELKDLILEAATHKANLETEKKAFEERKSLVMENAKFSKWKVWEDDGHSAKVSPKTDRELSVAALVKELISRSLKSQGTKEKDIESILEKLFPEKSEVLALLDAVLSVSLKDFDKYLGADVFKRLGGTTKEEPYGSIKIS